MRIKMNKQVCTDLVYMTAYDVLSKMFSNRHHGSLYIRVNDLFYINMSVKRIEDKKHPNWGVMSQILYIETERPEHLWKGYPSFKKDYAILYYTFINDDAINMIQDTVQNCLLPDKNADDKAWDNIPQIFVMYIGYEEDIPKSITVNCEGKNGEQIQIPILIRPLYEYSFEELPGYYPMSLIEEIEKDDYYPTYGYDPVNGINDLDYGEICELLSVYASIPCEPRFHSRRAPEEAHFGLLIGSGIHRNDEDVQTWVQDQDKLDLEKQIFARTFLGVEDSKQFDENDFGTYNGCLIEFVPKNTYDEEHLEEDKSLTDAVRHCADLYANDKPVPAKIFVVKLAEQMVDEYCSDSFAKKIGKKYKNGEPSEKVEAYVPVREYDYLEMEDDLDLYDSLNTYMNRQQIRL